MSTQSRVLIFCGKGGVGKTTLSLALGLRHAARGRKVVVVSSHPLSELALTVSLEGLAQQDRTAARHLFIVHLDPKELLAEVVQKNFPVAWAARAVLDSRIYRNLIEVAPGLKEFYFLARLQQLAERKAASGDPALDYDLLLWDAPATGHFLSTLRAAKSFETYLTGPLAIAGAEVARFFSNSSQIMPLATTTLEEMAIDETIEMTRTLERDYQLRCATVVLNLVSPLATAAEDEARQVLEAGRTARDPALRLAISRGSVEQERAAALRAAIAAPTIAVERVRRWSDDLDLLNQIGRSLEGLPVEP